MNIGLVLGGGFARGAAQAAFLKGLSEYLDKNDIRLISSSSIGALNGLALSNGHLDYLEKVYRTSDFQTMSNLRLNLKNRLVDQILDQLTDRQNKLEIPLYVTGTCLNNLSTYYFYLDCHTVQEEVYRAINITVTFPFVNGLFRKVGRCFYLDGGATDNIPVFPFFYRQMDLILILHCYPHYLPPLKLVESNATVIDIDVAARCDSKISTYSFQKANLNKMWEIGLAYGKEFGEKVFCSRDLTEIKRKGQAFMREELEIRKRKKVPLTAAVFFNRLQQSRGFK